MTKSLIIGIGGMDGTHLAEHLLNRGDEVYGVHRRTSSDNLQRTREAGLIGKVKLIEGDIADPHSMNSILNQVKPDEVYNVAAQSHVQTSFNQPKLTNDINYVGVLNILEWLRHNKTTKLYHSSTSEMFGDSITYKEEWHGMEYTENLRCKDITTEHLNNGEFYQDENTPFNPQSPYAISKLAAHQLCEVYKEAYNLKIWSAVLFNHEGPYRGEQFVTRKITKWCANFAKWVSNFHFNKLTFDDANIFCGSYQFPKLRLGNIDAIRDWGYAGEYTALMIQMLQQDTPDFYVVATGQSLTVKQFLLECFTISKFPESIWNNLFTIDKDLYRPAEVPYLRGRSDKVQKALNWSPKYHYKDIARLMLHHDLQS